MKQSMKDLAEYLTLLAQDGWTDIEAALNLCDVARQIETMDTDECNYPFDDIQMTRRDKRRARLEAEATALLPSPTWGLVHNADPRGATLKVTTPSSLTNDWGRTGVCVPRGL